MSRIVFWAIAVLAAAAIAYVIVVPHGRDELLPLQPAAPGEESGPHAGADSDAESETAAAPDIEFAPLTVPADEGASGPEAARSEGVPAQEVPDAPSAISDDPPREILAPDEDEAQEEPDEPPPPQVELGALEIEALPFDAECGLRLRPRGESDIIFASGISLDPDEGGPAAMRIDGDTVDLRRITTDGEPLGYNQYGRQLFEDEDGTVIVAMSIELEEEELLDTAEVSRGAITVMKAERSTLRVDVDGRVGC